jgi:hypothetical protein
MGGVMMIPSGDPELRIYAAREWNASTAYLVKKEMFRGARERVKVRRSRHHPERHLLVELERLVLRGVGIHR